MVGVVSHLINSESRHKKKIKKNFHIFLHKSCMSFAYLSKIKDMQMQSPIFKTNNTIITLWTLEAFCASYIIVYKITWGSFRLIWRLPIICINDECIMLFGIHTGLDLVWTVLPCCVLVLDMTIKVLSLHSQS